MVRGCAWRIGSNEAFLDREHPLDARPIHLDRSTDRPHPPRRTNSTNPIPAFAPWDSSYCYALA